MRMLRTLKRTLAVLAFVCMTLKIQLELRLVREGRNIGGYSPWWGNETLGHLRAFPKLARRPNITLSVLRATTSDGMVNVLPGYENLTRAHEQEGKSDPKTSNRKILSDVTNKTNPAAGKTSGAGAGTGAGTVSRNSGLIEHTVTAAESPSNHKTRAGIFAKLRIYDGENTIDTEAIYSSQRREVVGGEGTNASDDNTSIAQSDGKKETTRREKPPNVIIPKHKNGTSVPRRALVPMPKIGQRPPQPLARKVKSSALLRGVSHDVDKHEVSLTKEEIAQIKEELTQENELQTVYNQERFGPVLRNTTILLVQVHKRLENLRYLVASLRAVQGIKEAMVVFSHDFWDSDINAFVRNITDFRVMQMFFPFSIQLYPLLFPGRDPTDCSWNTKAEGKDKACLNANWPDSYGHYREASFTQIKHHWWWKIHRVFEGLRVTQNNYTGHVVFLEEDHYVSPDLLHVFGLMQRIRPALCPSCKVFALGNYNKMNPNVYKNYVERGDWWVTKYNLGFAMDAAVWRHLALCKVKFCNFDDYNWDWTLNNMAQTCFSHRVSMLAIRLSRVLHVGTCGTHVRKKVCDVRGEVRTAVTRLSSSKEWLFPSAVVMQGSWKNSGKPKKGNGGWGDHRDRELCLAIGNNTANGSTLARLQSLTSL